MSKSFKRFLCLTLGSVSVALAGGSVIAQQAQPDPSPPSFPSATPEPGPQVSEPEPAPNPVRERREQEAAGGVDPELGPISEPDADAVEPALRSKGNQGEWKRPEDSVRQRVRREAADRAAQIEQEIQRSAREAGAPAAGGNAGGANAGGGGSSSSGLIMPRLMAPNIPVVPMDLLFPPEVISAGPPPVRESRGSAIIIGALDREARTNQRIRIPAGGQGTFGSLRIKVSGCFMSHPEDSFESWAYVEVSDMGRANRNQLAVLPQRDRNRVKAATGERILRKGWIIASSPSVTPIDHPVYDMWLVNCEGNGGAAPQPQWPGGIAPPGQVGGPPAPTGGAAPAPAAGQATPPAPPASLPTGKSTGN